VAPLVQIIINLQGVFAPGTLRNADRQEWTALLRFEAGGRREATKTRPIKNPERIENKTATLPRQSAERKKGALWIVRQPASDLDVLRLPVFQNALSELALIHVNALSRLSVDVTLFIQPREERTQMRYHSLGRRALADRFSPFEF